MTSDSYLKTIDGLWRDYDSLLSHAGTIVRKAKKISSAETRRRLIVELRSLDNKRLEVLDQIDDITKI